jgi:hypothetical protein
MERITSAYGRALFPNRYRYRDRTTVGGDTASEHEPMALAPGNLDLSLAAAIYHLVGGAEALLAAFQRVAASWKTRPAPTPRSIPISCN